MDRVEADVQAHHEQHLDEVEVEAVDLEQGVPVDVDEHLGSAKEHRWVLD